VGVGGEGLQFADQPAEEYLLLVIGVYKAVEVAVVALVGAEGDVDIERPHRRVGLRVDPRAVVEQMEGYTVGHNGPVGGQVLAWLSAGGVLIGHKRGSLL
jgi:hypothetical protein